MTWQSKPQRPGPGATGEENRADTNGEAYSRNGNQRQATPSDCDWWLREAAVDLSIIAEGDFAAEVMRQLPGLPQPRIIILLMPPKHPVELDAQNLANEHGEPVAIVDMEAKLLAYRAPE
jgi:hypothetical protein